MNSVFVVKVNYIFIIIFLKRGHWVFEFSVLAIFQVGFSVFALKNIAFSVLLSIAVSGIFSFFSVWFSFFFLARIEQIRFPCLSLCSHMLGYFKSCLYFTVNPGQTAMWDSGVLIEVYNYRSAFCKRKIPSLVVFTLEPK